MVRRGGLRREMQHLVRRARFGLNSALLASSRTFALLPLQCVREAFAFE